MFERISEETSKTIVGNLPPKRWPELARALWEESVVAAFVGGAGGARFDEQYYNWSLPRKNMLLDDVDSIIQDESSFLYRQIVAETPKSVLDYKCGYKLMLNYNVLVAIDERDFLIPSEQLSLEELYFGIDD